MLLLLTTMFVISGSSDKPRALEAMEKSRNALDRVYIRWKWMDNFDQYSQGAPLSYETRIAGHDYSFTNNGTPEGVAAWHESGEPIPDSRISYLARENDRWELDVDLFKGRMWESPAPLQEEPDVRTIGLLPVPKTICTVTEAVWDFPNKSTARTYSERQVDGKFVVEMKLDDSNEVVTWVIDPQKDWNPIQVSLSVAGVTVTDCRSEYRQYDGVWFPESIVYYDGAGNAVTQIETESAEINKPDLPKSLAPEDIGFLSGTFVISSKDKEIGGGKTGVYLERRGFVTPAEFATLTKRGEAKTDERITRFFEKLREQGKLVGGSAASQAQSSPKNSKIIPNQVDDEWDRYTRDFIRHYKLDSEQTQKAELILKNVKERRTNYVQSKKRRFGELEVELKKPKDADHLIKLRNEFEALCKPISDLFENQLKPRLADLPTSRQKEVAGPFKPPTATAPVSK